MTGKRKGAKKKAIDQLEQNDHHDGDIEGVVEMGTQLNVNASQPEIMQRSENVINEEENTSHDSNEASKTSQAPRRRGPTKCISFSTYSNVRLQLEFNEKGQPIGEHSIAYSTFLGSVARDFGPISISTWHDMPKDLKDKMWTIVKQRFILPDQAKSTTLMRIGKCWCQYKSRLRIKFYDIHDNDRERISNCPPQVKTEDWKRFVTNISKPEYKQERERLKKAREHEKLPHTSSRKGYARLENEMMKNSDNPSSITRADVWRKAHTKKNGEPVNDLAKEKIEKLYENSSSGTCSKDDALSQVFGDDPYHVRGVGFGVSPSFLSGVEQSNLKWQHLEDEMKVLKDEVSCMNSMRQKIASLEAALAKSNSQLSNEQLSHEDQSSSIRKENSDLQRRRVSTCTTRVKCKLMSLGVPGDVVAIGYWYTDDPTAIVLHCPLGDGMSKVMIEVALKEETQLVRGNDELKTIKDTVGSFVAWPTFFISKE